MPEGATVGSGYAQLRDEEPLAAPVIGIRGVKDLVMAWTP